MNILDTDEVFWFKNYLKNRKMAKGYEIISDYHNIIRNVSLLIYVAFIVCFHIAWKNNQTYGALEMSIKNKIKK